MSRAEAVRAAHLVQQAAAEAEPTITATLQHVAATAGATLDGLQFRLKVVDRLTDKIEADMAELALSGAEAAEGIADAIRYTAVADVEQLAGVTEEMLESLEAAGYEVVQVKNTWKAAEAPYRGVNVQLRSPDGQLVELQFHTPESLNMKEETHPLYERARRPTTPPAEKAVLNERMVEMNRVLESPPGIGRIGPVGRLGS